MDYDQILTEAKAALEAARKGGVTGYELARLAARVSTLTRLAEAGD